ncbi:MAG: hypothetical protein ABI744_02870 [Chloroflexota bacterium]
MKRTTLSGVALATLLVVSACTGTGNNATPTVPASAVPTIAPVATPTMGHESMAPSMSPDASGSPSAALDTMTDAANLRTDLNYLFGEHLILASKATDAALGARQDEFDAYATLLNTNGTDIGAAIGSIYGADAQDQFNTIWSAHNGFFVDYTTGVATNDQAKKDTAVMHLTTDYVPQFSQFLATATGLSLDAVTALVTEHVTTTAAIVDAQGAEDWPAAFAAIRKAYAHMSMIGDALAPAIAQQNNIAGDASTPAVNFRTALDQLLQEHLFLASYATGAALGGRSDEFAAASDALNTNGTDIGAAIGSIYGADAQDQFNTIWSAHNGFFVDYTTGVATNDQAKKDTAVMHLTTDYVPQFSQFLATATGLSLDAVTALVTEHVTTTAAIVDAQGAGDAQAAATADRAAAMHMRMIGDPLAQAIVNAMPDKF